MPAPAGRPDPRSQRRDAGPIPLAPDESPAPVVRAAPCPSCGRSLRADAVLCVECGFDRRKGVHSVAAAPGEHKPIPCRECGYDLTGVVNATCPECGEPVRRGRVRLLADEREMTRTAYRKPLMAVGVGAALLLIFAGPVEGGLRLLAVPVCLPVAIVLYAVAKALWEGLDEPWSLLSVRALGVLTVAAGAGAALLPAPARAFTAVGLLCLGAMIVVVVATLMTACDEDPEESFLYAIGFLLVGAFGPAALVGLVG